MVDKASNPWLQCLAGALKADNLELLLDTFGNMPNIKQVFDVSVLVLQHLSYRQVPIGDEGAYWKEMLQEIQRTSKTLLLHMVAAVDFVALKRKHGGVHKADST